MASSTTKEDIESKGRNHNSHEPGDNTNHNENENVDGGGPPPPPTSVSSQQQPFSSSGGASAAATVHSDKGKRSDREHQTKKKKKQQQQAQQQQPIGRLPLPSEEKSDNDDIQENQQPAKQPIRKRHRGEKRKLNKGKSHPGVTSSRQAVGTKEISASDGDDSDDDDDLELSSASSSDHSDERIGAVEVHGINYTEGGGGGEGERMASITDQTSISFEPPNNNNNNNNNTQDGILLQATLVKEPTQVPYARASILVQQDGQQQTRRNRRMVAFSVTVFVMSIVVVVVVVVLVQSPVPPPPPSSVSPSMVPSTIIPTLEPSPIPSFNPSTAPPTATCDLVVNTTCINYRGEICDDDIFSHIPCPTSIQQITFQFRNIRGFCNNSRHKQDDYFTCKDFFNTTTTTTSTSSPPSSSSSLVGSDIFYIIAQGLIGKEIYFDGWVSTTINDYPIIEFSADNELELFTTVSIYSSSSSIGNLTTISNRHLRPDDNTTTTLVQQFTFQSGCLDGFYGTSSNSLLEWDQFGALRMIGVVPQFSVPLITPLPGTIQFNVTNLGGPIQINEFNVISNIYGYVNFTPPKDSIILDGGETYSTTLPISIDAIRTRYNFYTVVIGEPIVNVMNSLGGGDGTECHDDHFYEFIGGTSLATFTPTVSPAPTGTWSPAPTIGASG